MSLELDASPTFAAHQTFHPRFGWLKKSFDGVVSNPGIFSSENAMIQLGVGKNMVEAIKFWGQAFKVIIQNSTSGKGKGQMSVTHLGNLIFNDELGLDPYLENPSTLWLFHWFALTAPTDLPLWRIMFNEYSAVEFRVEEFSEFVDEQLSGTSWRIPVQASLDKDIDCIIRMYSTRSARGRQTIDDLMDSPFRSLDAISPSPAGEGHFRLSLGRKPHLTDLVILYSSIDFMVTSDSNSHSVTSTRLARDSGSPGRLFKISEEEIIQNLESACAKVKSCALVAPAGTTQLMIRESHEKSAREILDQLYGKRLSSSLNQVVGASLRQSSETLGLALSEIKK